MKFRFYVDLWPGLRTIAIRADSNNAAVRENRTVQTCGFRCDDTRLVAVRTGCRSTGSQPSRNSLSNPNDVCQHTPP